MTLIFQAIDFLSVNPDKTNNIFYIFIFFLIMNSFQNILIPKAYWKKLKELLLKLY